jgi:arabinose-5-phosphate isomerase
MQTIKTNLISSAKKVIAIECDAISNLSKNINQDFAKACTAILHTKGRVIVMGIGKSGNIGKKMSATLASTGTPSLFVHPADAYHGDLGMITKQDIVLAISYSGETEEVIQLLPYLKDKKIVLISMTGNASSTLAQHSAFHLNVSVKKEACPLQLAPTSSTTATLVMGDALAVALMKERNFQPDDFAALHPGGSLGKRLLTKVEHVMHRQPLPILSPSTLVSNVLSAMSSGRLGLAIVCEKDKLKGIITDGDLRRAIEKYREKIFSIEVKEIMTLKPKTIHPSAKVIEAENLCNQHKITSLMVTEKQKVVGVFQIYNTVKI